MTDNNYKLLEEDAKKIGSLVKRERFRNTDAFLDRAVQILLTWELDPKRSLDIMKGYPQTEEQKQVLQMMLDKKIYESNFPKENQSQLNEYQRLEEKNKSDNDYLKLLDKLENTRNYMKTFEIPEFGNNEISYDQYPILFRFYSRFAPAKIVLCVLADLLRQNPTSNKINLKILRADALDIAAEFNKEILKYEKLNSVKRTQKISTGFPKLSEDLEENVAVHKRFREQYVGKVRIERDTGDEYFEGILAALGFVKLIKEGSEEFITFTKRGRDFYLLDNPILNGDYTRGLYDKEAEFILEKIIPEFKLESMFYDTALRTIQKYQVDSKLQKDPITKILDQEIIKTTNDYVLKNPKDAEGFGIEKIEFEKDGDTISKTNQKYVEGWRVATMGRLVELKQIEWSLEKGKSVFQIRNKKETIAN